MRRLYFCGLGVALLIGAAPASAQLLDLSDATVARAGELEIEAQPAGYAAVIDQHGRRDQVVSSLNVVMGLGSGWDLTYTGRAPFDVNDPSESELDSSLLFRVMLLEGGYSRGDGDGPSLALQWGAYLPVIEGEDGFAPSVGLLGSQMLGEASVHLHVELILSRQREAQLFTVVQLLGPEAWIIQPVVEGWVDYVDDVAIVSGLAGAVVPLVDDVALEAGVRVAGQAREIEIEGRLLLRVQTRWLPRALD